MNIIDKMDKVDTLWLSRNVIDKLFVLYEHRIHKWNCDYDLQNPFKRHASLKTNEITFQDALYLLHVYLEGHLWILPLGKVSTEYYVSNRIILAELCKRGILTIQGDVSPSSHEFIVVIHDDIITQFTEMLFVMSSLNLSITMQVVKHGTIISTNSFEKEKLGFSNLVNKNIAINFSKNLNHNVCHIVMKSDEYVVTDILLHYWFSFNSKYGQININNC